MIFEIAGFLIRMVILLFLVALCVGAIAIGLKVMFLILYYTWPLLVVFAMVAIIRGVK